MMKETKTKAAAKPKKAADTAKPVRKKKAASDKKMPTEDEIREKAREIYYERMARGEHGSPEGDWHEAEELLKNS